MNRANLIVCVVLALTPSVALAAETTTFTYDALGRLVLSTNVGGPRANVNTATTFDPAGNRAVQAVGTPAVSTTAASVSITSASAVDGGRPAIFTLTKSGTAAATLSVNFATSNGDAVAPTDYTATSGTTTFLAWETVKTISVNTVVRNSVPSRQFSVALSTPTAGLTIGIATGTGTINAFGAANRPPVANTDAVSAKICLSATVNVLANDTDPEGNYPLLLLSVGSSPLGSTGISSATDVTFNAFGATGSGSTTYTVKDSLGAISTGQLNITVTNGTGCSRIRGKAVFKKSPGNESAMIGVENKIIADRSANPDTIIAQGTSH